MSKSQLDGRLGRNKWRALRRRGIEQHEKVRGIDNARTSRHNAAACLFETIMTAPPDIAIQVLLWLAAAGIPASWETFLALRPTLGSDHLEAAYHRVPNTSNQLALCVVMFMDTSLAQPRVAFAISYAHLFGFSAAVVNFNRLPELLTSIARRIGRCITWHCFDDPGVLRVPECPDRRRNAR